MGSQPLTTTYKKDYVQHESRRQQSYNDGKKRTHLTYDSKPFVCLENASPPPKSTAVDFANEYLGNTFKHEQPKLYEKYFQEALHKKDEDMFVDQMSSTYEKTYGRPPKKHWDIDLSSLSPQSLSTTYRSNYRSPDVYGPISPTQSVLNESVLAHDHAVIINITHKESLSEYQDAICFKGLLSSSKLIPSRS